MSEIWDIEFWSVGHVGAMYHVFSLIGTTAIDPKSHRLYLSAATIAPASGQPQGAGRRNYVPGSFVIIVVGD